MNEPRRDAPPHDTRLRDAEARDLVRLAVYQNMREAARNSQTRSLIELSEREHYEERND